MISPQTHTTSALLDNSRAAIDLSLSGLLVAGGESLIIIGRNGI